MQELERREYEILSDRLGRTLTPGTPEGAAEMWLARRESWAANDPRWRWLGDFVDLIEHVASVASSDERDEHDAAWFVHAAGALTRLVPTLTEVFDINNNDGTDEARETALAELERLAVAVKEEGAETR